MWNPFRRRKNKKQLRELQNVSSAFAIIGEFNRRGLIHWQVKSKMLLIEEQLALVQLAQGAEGFQRFLQHVCDWQNYNLMANAYEEQRIRVESAAVREAESKEGKVLTNADIQRIRQKARNSMQVTDPKDMKNLIREFDMLIIRAGAPAIANATQENGQLLAVGHYDGEKLELAMYDDVKSSLQDESYQDNNKEG